MKNACLSLVFACLAAHALQAQSCTFDRIDYKQYYAVFLGSKGPFKDYKTMLEKDVPARYWTDYYANGRIVKRVFGDTWMGSNRRETYFYRDSLLVNVTCSGGAFVESIDFEYDQANRLAKCVQHMIGNQLATDEFSYSGDTIFVRRITGEGAFTEPIVVDETYRLNRYPYGNHLVYDETFTIQAFDTGDFEFERYYDACGNLQYRVKRLKENDNIFELVVFNIHYRE